MPRMKNFNYAAPGTSVRSWFDVADRAEMHACKERRQYSRCNCGRRKRNPCKEAIEIRDHCCERGMSDGPDSLDVGDNGINMATIFAFFTRKTCHESRAGGACNHAGCVKTESVLDWLAEQISSALLTQPSREEIKALSKTKSIKVSSAAASAL